MNDHKMTLKEIVFLSDTERKNALDILITNDLQNISYEINLDPQHFLEIVAPLLQDGDEQRIVTICSEKMKTYYNLVWLLELFKRKETLDTPEMMTYLYLMNNVINMENQALINILFSA